MRTMQDLVTVDKVDSRTILEGVGVSESRSSRELERQRVGV